MKNLAFFEKTAPRRDRWKRRNKYYWKDLENFCVYLVPEHASVLEVGCGTGDLLASLRTKNKTGIDFSPRMIEIAKKKYPQGKFQVSDARTSPFPENFFDKVYSISVLHHFPSRDFQLQYLKEANRSFVYLQALFCYNPFP